MRARVCACLRILSYETKCQERGSGTGGGLGGVPLLLPEVDVSVWLFRFRFDDTSGMSSAAFCSLKGFSTASKCPRRGCYGLW